MSTSLVKKISLSLASALLLALPASPVVLAASAPLPTSRPAYGLHKHTSATAALTQSASENWSGYAATGANGTFTSVSSSWVQPTLNCTTEKTAYSAYWVGLDGYNDQTVEQIGTEANCINGQAQYYTWYEMYPQNPSELATKLVVSPGDSVSAAVSYTPPTTTTTHGRTRTSGTGSFTLLLTDTTTGASYSTTQTPRGTFGRSSAEVITEAPYSNGILPLANFGTMNYATSKVNGQALGTAPGLQSITMEDPYGMIATPSALDVTNQNFSITWSDPS